MPVCRTSTSTESRLQRHPSGFCRRRRRDASAFGAWASMSAGGGLHHRHDAGADGGRAAPAMPRRRRRDRAAAGVRCRAAVGAAGTGARRRASPPFPGGCAIRPVDCRSGGCGFESRPPRFKTPPAPCRGRFRCNVRIATTRPILSSDTPSQQRKLARPPEGETVRPWRKRHSPRTQCRPLIGASRGPASLRRGRVSRESGL